MTDFETLRPNLLKTYYNELLHRKLNPLTEPPKLRSKLSRAQSEKQVKMIKRRTTQIQTSGISVETSEPSNEVPCSRKSSESRKPNLLRRMSINGINFLKLARAERSEEEATQSSSSPAAAGSPASASASSSVPPLSKWVPKIVMGTAFPLHFSLSILSNQTLFVVSLVAEASQATGSSTPRRSWFPSVFGDGGKVSTSKLKNGIESKKPIEEITREIRETLNVMGAPFKFSSKKDKMKAATVKDGKTIRFDVVIAKTGMDSALPVFYVALIHQSGDKAAFSDVRTKFFVLLNV